MQLWLAIFQPYQQWRAECWRCGDLSVWNSCRLCSVDLRHSTFAADSRIGYKIHRPNMITELQNHIEPCLDYCALTDIWKLLVFCEFEMQDGVWHAFCVCVVSSCDWKTVIFVEIWRAGVLFVYVNHYCALTDIWKASVKATHDFVSADDIEFYSDRIPRDYMVLQKNIESNRPVKIKKSLVTKGMPEKTATLAESDQIIPVSSLMGNYDWQYFSHISNEGQSVGAVEIYPRCFRRKTRKNHGQNKCVEFFHKNK
mgnify:CR=1 FL=1